MQSVLFDPSQVRGTRPRAVTSFRRRDLNRRDKLVVADYQDELEMGLGRLPNVAGLSMPEADELLHDISSKSPLALPG